MEPAKHRKQAIKPSKKITLDALFAEMFDGEVVKAANEVSVTTDEDDGDKDTLKSGLMFVASKGKLRSMLVVELSVRKTLFVIATITTSVVGYVTYHWPIFVAFYEALLQGSLQCP